MRRVRLPYPALFGFSPRVDLGVKSIRQTLVLNAAPIRASAVSKTTMKPIAIEFRRVVVIGSIYLTLIAVPVRAQIAGPGVYAWGSNIGGQLGNGTTTGSSVAVAVRGFSGDNVVAIAGGFYHDVALTDAGAVYAWGNNNYGQMGTGATGSFTPVVVTGLSGVNVSSVATGMYHSLAVANSGAVYAWGDNRYGQLGTGNTTQQNIPVLVTALSGAGVTAVAGGEEHSLALTGSGAVYAWGSNGYGRAGDREPRRLVHAGPGHRIVRCRRHRNRGRRIVQPGRDKQWQGLRLGAAMTLANWGTGPPTLRPRRRWLLGFGRHRHGGRGRDGPQPSADQYGCGLRLGGGR